MANSLAQVQQKDINVLHAMLGHPLEVISRVTGRSMGFNLTDMLKPCECCSLRETKKGGVSKRLLSKPKF